MRIDQTQHKNVLLQILKDIFSNPAIGPYVGFKGGTAVYLFYDLPRFSVDLDFDLLNPEKENVVFESIKEILETHGVIKEATNKRYNLFFLLSYHNKENSTPNIKVEINKRIFGSQYELKSYLSVPMKVMVQKDITANKMVAMHERIGKTNRDIFDVQFFLRNHWPINEKIIEQRTSMSYKDFLKTVITELEQVNNNTILHGLGELLTEKQKAWVRSHLKDDTIFALKLVLNNEKTD